MAKKKATTKKAASKKAPAKKSGGYDWTAQFNNPKVRKAMTDMVRATACKDECILEPEMSPETFAHTLLVYVPKAYKYLPPALVPDSEKQKAMVLMAELAKKDEENTWKRWDDPDPNTACALIMLMSRGVKSLDFTYSGGWDETSYDDSCYVEYHDGAISDALTKKFESNFSAEEEHTAKLFAEVKEETGVEDRDILYKFLDDSGAGDGNTYSQSLRVNLEEWSIALHDYEEDESYDDEDESE